MRKHDEKRLLGIFFCICVVVGVLSIHAFADESLPQSIAGASVSVTKTFRYNGAPQTLEAADVTVTLEGTPLAAGTGYTVTAASQTYPGTYSFTVTGTGNYTGEVTGNWKIEKGQLDDKYKTIYLKLKPGGDSITFDAADMLPDMGGRCNILPNQGRHVILQANGTLITISCQGNAGDDVMAQLVIYSTYYEDSYLTLQIERVDSLDGNSCPLTVTMADWNVGDKPNKPTISGLPETRYNYRVAYAKKDGTQLSGVPSNGGQYTVTASCVDAENNIYSGSAEFSVWMEVTFNPNGGTLPADTVATVRINTETLDPLPVPTWTDHTFLGWFTARTEGSQVDKDTVYTGNTTLYARWKIHTYTIAFDANGGEGEMDPLTMTYGKTANLTANGFARDGYRFTGWNTQADGKGDAHPDETIISNLTTVDGGKVTLYAQWIKVIDRVNLSTSGYGLDKSVEQVKVTTADGVSFAGSYPTGWGITKSPSDLTPLYGQLFQADTQYYLWVSFSAKEGCVLEGLNEKNVFLDGKAAEDVENAQGVVKAVFRLPVIHTIELNCGKNGSITYEDVVCTNDEPVTVGVQEGENATFTITPNSGYIIADVKVDGKSVGAVKTYTFTEVVGAHTIQAEFKLKASYEVPFFYVIQASAGKGGSISPDGNSLVLYGSSRTYTITPNSGYAIADVKVDGQSIGAVSSFTFQCVVRNYTIEAVFAQIPIEQPTEEKPIEEVPTIIELPFTDVSRADWFYEDAVYVYANDLMKGTGETIFDPNLTTTRGMIVTVLYRMAGEPVVTAAAPFDDVASGSYYEKAITWAASNAIVSGYGNGNFGPNDPITREQLAVILYRFTQYQKLSVGTGENMDILSYHDAQDISAYALTAMQWICGEGVMQGSGENLLPRDNATRSQVAAILHRYCENVMM